jgi:hypothetical protein
MRISALQSTQKFMYYNSSFQTNLQKKGLYFLYKLTDAFRIYDLMGSGFNKNHQDYA